jgi:hypothetical protein
LRPQNANEYREEASQLHAIMNRLLCAARGGAGGLDCPRRL